MHKLLKIVPVVGISPVRTAPDLVDTKIVRKIWYLRKGKDFIEFLLKKI